MLILTPIVIDLMDPDPLPIVNAKQGDTGRGLRVTIAIGGEICQLTSEGVNVFARKTDGKVVYNTCKVQGGDIVVMFTNQALAVPGKLQMEMEIVSGKDRVSTPIALVNVLPTNITAEAIESTNEFEKYQTVIEDAEAAAETAKRIAKDITDRLIAGEFNGKDGKNGNIGPQGEKGDKGDPGESGITAPVNGFFTLSVDADGNLWAYSAPDGMSIGFEYDEENGNLYVVQEVG